MQTYKILYTRNDLAKLEWREWLNGYPKRNADEEIAKLKANNKQFDFKLEAQGKECDSRVAAHISYQGY